MINSNSSIVKQNIINLNLNKIHKIYTRAYKISYNKGFVLAYFEIKSNLNYVFLLLMIDLHLQEFHFLIRQSKFTL